MTTVVPLRQRLRSLSIAILLAVGLCTGTRVSAQTVGEEVRSFSADIQVRMDGTVLVAERIEYVFPTPRHGIIRTIPVHYIEDGTRISIPVTVQKVSTPEGVPINYKVERAGGAIDVRIGDADRTVTGTQSYVITYLVTGALKYYDDHDELHWNVTGLGWEVPIRRASATVRVPEEAIGTGVRTECFTGPQGSTAKECLGAAKGGTAFFAANEPLTIVVGWAPGVVKKVLPKKGLFSSFAISDDIGIWAGVALPFILLILAAWALMRVKPVSTPSSGTLVVQYDPPAGMTPAETGVMAGKGVQGSAIAATIVDMAVRGYVKIRETGSDHVLMKLKDFDQDATLKPFEKETLTAVFGMGNTAALSVLKQTYAFVPFLPVIDRKLRTGFTELGFYTTEGAEEKARVGGIGAFLSLLGTIAFVRMAVGDILPVATIPATVMLLALTAYFVGKMVVAYLPRKTAAGNAASDHALGFKEYLATAEKYRLEWQEKEGAFEKLLPYAMALDVVEKWTNALASLMVTPPEWYEGADPAHFSAVNFAGSLHSFQRAAAGTAVAAPPPPPSTYRTSGRSGFSSGGGFSGGGRGGGGGRSW